MTNLQNITNILGLILCVTTSLLTFSRGILALVLVVLYIYVCLVSLKIKIIISLVLFSVVIFSLSNSVMGAN